MGGSGDIFAGYGCVLGYGQKKGGRYGRCRWWAALELRVEKLGGMK